MYHYDGKRTILRLDSTQITAFCSCPSLWHYEHDMRIDSIEARPKTAMNIGSYGHKLMEIYYKERASGNNFNGSIEKAFAYDFDRETCRCGHGREQHTEAVAKVIPCRDKNKDSRILKITREKLLPNCQHIGCKCDAFTPCPFPLSAADRQATRDRFNLYCLTYSMKDIEPLSAEHVEVGFSIPIYDSDTKLYILEGRIDLMGTLGNDMVYADHKWQMRKNDLYTRSIQFRNYCLATGMTVGVINYVRMAKNIDENTFRRDIINFSKLEQKAWQEELIAIYEKIAIFCEVQEKNPYIWDMPEAKNRSSCPGRYGYQCPYTQICDEVDPWLRRQKENMLFQVRPLWQPWG